MMRAHFNFKDVFQTSSCKWALEFSRLSKASGDLHRVSYGAGEASCRAWLLHMVDSHSLRNGFALILPRSNSEQKAPRKSGGYAGGASSIGALSGIQHTRSSVGSSGYVTWRYRSTARVWHSMC